MLCTDVLKDPVSGLRLESENRTRQQDKYGLLTDGPCCCSGVLEADGWISSKVSASGKTTRRGLLYVSWYDQLYAHLGISLADAPTAWTREEQGPQVPALLNRGHCHCSRITDLSVRF